MSRDRKRDLWSLVHAERAALVADLAGLSEQQWATESLCAGWTVHDVAAHLVTNAQATVLGVFRDMLRARMDFDRQNQEGVERGRGATPGETLDRLRAVVGRTSTPAAVESRLVEEVLHGEDIRRPLGLAHSYDPAAVEGALRYQARTPVAFGGVKQRIAHLRLEATDADLTLGGVGPVVRGPLLSLLLATSGRTVALADLTGDGVAALR